MDKEDQRADDAQALGLLLAEWGKAVGDYAASVAVRHLPASAPEPGGQSPAATVRTAELRRQQALALLEETSGRLAIVLSRHWRPSRDDS